MNLSFIRFGCEFTPYNFLIGMIGGLVAVLILPGCYTTIPWFTRGENDEIIFHWGALGRLVVAGIAGCVLDCNTRNTFFGGFFGWHLFRWAGNEGWQSIKARLRSFLEAKQ